MPPPGFAERRQLERLDRDALARLQLQKLNRMLAEILPQNRFYASKLGQLKLPLGSLDAFFELPDTCKAELADRGEATEFAANLTYPVERYVRFHRTSGTRGRPLVVLDTPRDWQWWLDTWQFVLDAAEIGDGDRVFMAFSFGPFIGFWSAFDSAVARGALVIPGGGFSSAARIDLIDRQRVTALFCTPTYALHLAEVARQQQVDLTRTAVRRIIVAGEAGGSLPAVRQRIESSWNARVIDHSGASEVGPWGYSSADQKGLHLIESEFLGEFRSVKTGRPAAEGELAELMLTTLGRHGCPVLRYRTGDLVRPVWNSAGPNRFVLLDGGVLGRVDDMLVIRGVNIFPSSLDQILRSFPEVVEYRVTAFKTGEMDTLSVEVEDRLDDPARIRRELDVRLGLKVDVQTVEIGALPRFEGKGHRFVDQRTRRGQDTAT